MAAGILLLSLSRRDGSAASPPMSLHLARAHHLMTFARDSETVAAPIDAAAQSGTPEELAAQREIAERELNDYLRRA